MAIDESWVEHHAADEAQLAPPNSTAVESPIERLSELLESWAESFALNRFGASVPFRVGGRGLHPDETASFLRALDAGHVVVEDDGRFHSTCSRPKQGGGVYNLFSANRWDDDLHVSLNTEYLVHFGAATELVTAWGWQPSDVEVEVGEYDARCWSAGRVVLAVEAKARVEGADGLASLLTSFLRFAGTTPPEPLDNHSRKYVELLALTESGPVVVWLVAAGARWPFVATRSNNRITFEEVDEPVSIGADPSTAAVQPPGLEPRPKASVDHAVAIATLTESDTRQRVYEWRWADETQVRAFIDRLQTALLDGGIEHTRPWVWFASTSGGTHLSHLGKDTGLELRFSYYA